MTINTKHALQRLAIALTVLMTISACERTQPIYNVDHDVVPEATQEKLSAKQVGDIIAKTAVSKGWVVNRVKPGLLHCSIKWREHSAVVDITYSKHNYNIHLDSSENLLQSNGMIHRNYNERVQQLQDEIDRKLSGAAYN